MEWHWFVGGYPNRGPAGGDPYAQVSTMRMWLVVDRAGPYDGMLCGPARSLHSYSVCRNRISASGGL